ncbi:MAG: hypothetical protein ACP5JP_04920 [bacterium]
MERLIVFMGLCLVGQLAMEIIAYTFKLWIYTSKKNFIIHIILAVVIVFGLLSYLLSNFHWYIRYPAGVLVGLLYEYSNISGLDMFYFPGNKFLIFKGKTSIIIVISLMWGLYPLFVPIVYRLIAPILKLG